MNSTIQIDCLLQFVWSFGSVHAGNCEGYALLEVKDYENPRGNIQIESLTQTCIHILMHPAKCDSILASSLEASDKLMKAKFTD